jgi:hypothetical protein
MNRSVSQLMLCLRDGATKVGYPVAFVDFAIREQRRDIVTISMGEEVQMSSLEEF